MSIKELSRELIVTPTPAALVRNHYALHFDGKHIHVTVLATFQLG